MEIEKALQTIQDHLCKGESKGKHIVVLDRGWVFAGNLTKLDDDGYLLTDCVNIRSWKNVGFGGLTKSAKKAGAVLDESRPIKFRSGAMILCVPIAEDWQC